MASTAPSLQAGPLHLGGQRYRTIGHGETTSEDGSNLIRISSDGHVVPADLPRCQSSRGCCSCEQVRDTDGSTALLLYLSTCRTFTFELWAEGEKLLRNLDIVMALVAFYHLCFVMDMNYPKVGGEQSVEL